MDYKYYSKYGIIIYSENKRIELTPKENHIFYFLHENKFATMEQLCNCIFDNKLYVYSKDNVRVKIFSINKKIEPIGKIKNRRGLGFKLVNKN